MSIVNAILRILAANRMTEAARFETMTIHRLLEIDPRGGGFKRNVDNPIDCGPPVVGETSLVDVMLMLALLGGSR